MAYRIIIRPPFENQPERTIIETSLGEHVEGFDTREEAIEWLNDHGCWPGEADQVHDYQHDTVYWISSDPQGNDEEIPA